MFHKLSNISQNLPAQHAFTISTVSKKNDKNFTVVPCQLHIQVYERKMLMLIYLKLSRIEENFCTF